MRIVLVIGSRCLSRWLLLLYYYDDDDDDDDDDDPPPPKIAAIAQNSTICKTTFPSQRETKNDNKQFFLCLISALNYHQCRDRFGGQLLRGRLIHRGQ